MPSTVPRLVGDWARGKFTSRLSDAMVIKPDKSHWLKSFKQEKQWSLMQRPLTQMHVAIQIRYDKLHKI